MAALFETVRPQLPLSETAKRELQGRTRGGLLETSAL